MPNLERARMLPEKVLPDVTQLLADGRRLAEGITVGPSAFLAAYGVHSESEYKRRRMAEGTLMFHAQFGYRSLDKSRRAYGEIHGRLDRAGYRVDRYGICLDWSMGYPAVQRADRPRGTGLILQNAAEFAALTQEAPVAPHFGDFVIGTPASVENTGAALAAGATSIGNLGQYFTFRMPGWHDDVATTGETIKSVALCAAQPVEILIHSNLDDGFAALFCDMACGIGAVLLERHIIDDLIGARVSHCFGHTYSDPLTRLAFQRALAQVTGTPGSMVYGNTTIYVADQVENYANLASYLLVDIVAQRAQPAGHGLNPVPVTEALRIPEIDEIVEAHLFANRLALRAEGFEALFDLEKADEVARRLVAGGRAFKERVLNGLNEAGIDIQNPFELLLSLRRIGAKELEERFGPGKPRDGVVRSRVPVVRATTVAALEEQGQDSIAALSPAEQAVVHRAGFVGCVTSTDVHEYGKILVEAVLEGLAVAVVDAGVSADPARVAVQALEAGADFVAISTYNGVALAYVVSLRREMKRVGLDLPIFVGGKLNQIPEDSHSSLPVDVSVELRDLGAFACHRVEDMLYELVAMAQRRQS